MSNAIIKQQGDSPIVADNIFQIRLGRALSFWVRWRARS